MARLEAILTDEVKQKLVDIAKQDNRSITKELIQLIEDRYKQLNKQVAFSLFKIKEVTLLNMKIYNEECPDYDPIKNSIVCQHHIKTNIIEPCKNNCALDFMKESYIDNVMCKNSRE